MPEKVEVAVNELIVMAMNANMDMLQLAALFQRKADELKKQMAELPT